VRFPANEVIGLHCAVRHRRVQMLVGDNEEKGTFGQEICQSVPFSMLRLHILDAVDEGLELAAAAGVTELAEGLGLYLTDALAGDLEGLANLFKGIL